MGMVLFTTSGSFKPSDYGLSAGDAIQVIAVGGGAGPGVRDGSKNYSGSAGSTSSLGSLVTAAGGSTSTGYTQPTAQEGSCQGGLYAAGNWGYYWQSGSAVSGGGSIAGGCGGDGWLPGRASGTCPTTAFLTAINNLSGAPNRAWNGPIIINIADYLFNLVVNFTQSYNDISNDAQDVAQTGTRGGWGSVYNNYTGSIDSGGAGGIGYGAGGGGAARQSTSGQSVFGSGGNGGVVKILPLTLTASHVATAHTVTVGNGGAGYFSKTGGGARGAVAVFW